MASNLENFDDTAAFGALLDYVRSNRGFDFAGYKQPSLMRRVIRRLQTVGVTSFNDYIDYLEVHPDEFQHLFNTLLINVTSFFRDASSWEVLQTEIVPAILRAKADSEPIRIWSAASTMAMEKKLTPSPLCWRRCWALSSFRPESKSMPPISMKKP